MKSQKLCLPGVSSSLKHLSLGTLEGPFMLDNADLYPFLD